MKILFFLCVAILFGCSTPNGQVVDSPPGLDDAIRERVSKPREGTVYTARGWNVRAYKNDVYLVSLDVVRESKDANSNITKKSEQVLLVAQKGKTPEGADRWQLDVADKENMRVLGIKP